MKNKQELDLIDRDWLSAECVRAILDPQEALDFLLARIKNAKPIDAVPVVHGRWQRLIVDRRHQIEGDECSACGFVYGGLGIAYFRYCPNCGAKMDGGSE